MLIDTVPIIAVWRIRNDFIRIWILINGIWIRNKICPSLGLTSQKKIKKFNGS